MYKYCKYTIDDKVVLRSRDLSRKSYLYWKCIVLVIIIFYLMTFYAKCQIQSEMRKISSSLFSQHVSTRCRRAFRRRACYYGRPEPRGLRYPATVSRISGEILRIFQSTEGSLSAKLHITISRFDIREAGACLRACEHVARSRTSVSHRGYTVQC